MESIPMENSMLFVDQACDFVIDFNVVADFDIETIIND